MCNSCGLSADIAGKSLGIDSLLSPASFSKNSHAGKNRQFSSIFNRLFRPFVHIKFSLNQSVGVQFSTVSTQPTISTTKLNKLLNK